MEYVFQIQKREIYRCLKIIISQRWQMAIRKIMFSGHNSAVVHTNIQLLQQPTISKTKIPAGVEKK